MPSVRSGVDRVVDVLAAASVASWGVSLWLHADGPPTSVRIAISSLDAIVALLFLTRAGALAHGSAWSIVASVPSIVAATTAVRIAPERWPLAAEVGFGLATLLAIVSLLALGRSFAILPARRALVARGPYRLIRHPAYASELAMAIAAGAASSWWIALVVGAVVLLSLLPRIRAEEAVLRGDDAWRAYAERVPARLIPGLY